MAPPSYRLSNGVLSFAEKIKSLSGLNKNLGALLLSYLPSSATYWSVPFAALMLTEFSFVVNPAGLFTQFQVFANPGIFVDSCATNRKQTVSNMITKIKQYVYFI